jgi:HTH-type transcriptional regulator/antitoxin HigA
MPNTTPTPGKPDGAFSIEALAEIPVMQFAGEYLRPIDNEEQYELTKQVLYALMTQSPDEPGHPANGLINVLGILIEQYEDAHYPIPEASPGEVFKFLMEQHDLTQDQLPEIGTQGVVSEILRGRRKLNVRQIEALSQRFNVSPAVFFPKSQPMAEAG